MKPKELKIDDLIQVSKGCILPKGTICKVTGLSNSFFSDKPELTVTTIDEEVIRILSCEDIEGIPLTQKILCKNKWEVNAIDYDYSIKNKLFFREFTDSKTGGVELEVYNNIAPSDSFDVCQDDFYLGTISYVHELQHLLFGLNINHEMEV